jgi:hypothetical protein
LTIVSACDAEANATAKSMAPNPYFLIILQPGQAMVIRSTRGATAWTICQRFVSSPPQRKKRRILFLSSI